MAKNRDQKEVIVIGAGAAGLMSAIAAARRGADVTVLNHHSVPGKKILSTGNGKCNFTNEIQNPSCYRSDDPGLVASALERFSEKDAVAFFEDIGVCSKSKNGYFYPYSGQAVTVRDALLAEADHLGVRIINDAQISRVSFSGGRFRIGMKPEGLSAENCILATGGISAPSTGSDGSGYAYAREFGHSLITPLPALVPLISGEKWLRRTAGVRCDGSVTLYIDGKKCAFDRGELQFTGAGISGIPVFQISRYASAALFEGRRAEAVIDFFPDRSEEELKEILSGMAKRLGDHKSWYMILCGLVNAKIASMICEREKADHSPVSRYLEKAVSKSAAAIAADLKRSLVPISAAGSPEHAQTTCGGIPLSEIGPDMQSKKLPGLYFAGEILNVDGICGGYNLQWAWTSGFLAGTGAAGQGA